MHSTQGGHAWNAIPACASLCCLQDGKGQGVSVSLNVTAKVVAFGKDWVMRCVGVCCRCATSAHRVCQWKLVAICAISPGKPLAAGTCCMDCHCVVYVVVGLFSVSLSVSENFLPVPPSVCLSVWMCLSPLTLPLFIYNHWQRDSPCLCYQHDDVAFPPMFISNNKPCNQLNKTRASCTQ